MTLMGFGMMWLWSYKFKICNFTVIFNVHLELVHSVEKPGFKQLVSRFAPNLQLHGWTFLTQLLEIKSIHHRQILCTDASTTVDA